MEMTKPEAQSIIYHGTIVFSHLFWFLGEREYSFEECAKQIEYTYDPSEPRTAAVVEAFRSARGKIVASDLLHNNWKVIFDV